ncbi:DUF397 domain-containing protein [Streptomyces sp. NBC_01443]|uniref:DUF397 domain-containing protein n=1 Tax=Streptomyces sp. NBC_01443 TaxID=2903868 RepID=UPI0022586D46|nr:DUF397 domain-containing protein [Streptomyces sp. NBC_01443]MCX4629179.1 DUF397 domain-containing protein [Streptomyces sp. NBC_01443]
MTSTREYDLSTATWHKSSYSDGTGGDCLEMATWRKSTHSAGDGGNCLEVAAGHPDLVPVRDSKVPDGPHLAFNGPAWTAFVASLC